MREIYFWFRYKFQTEGGDGFHRVGPLFRGWLPGIEDAVKVNNVESGCTVKLFFNPQFQTIKGSGRYPVLSNDPRLDDNIDIANSYPLDGGPLHGAASLSISEAEYQSFAAAKKADDTWRVNESKEYVDVAKRINLILTPIIKTFVGLIASKYGHVWFMPAKRNGSQAVSMQVEHLSDLTIYWSLKEEGPWECLNPRNDITVVVRTYDPDNPGWYFGEKDWTQVETDLESFEDKSLAAEFLSQALRELMDENIRHAVIDIITAFEVAFSQHLAEIDSDDKDVRNDIDNFDRAPALKHKVIAAYSFLEIHDKDILQRALRCIDLRNDFAHWGKMKKSGLPHYSAQKSAVEAMAQIVSMLLFGRELTIPIRNTQHYVKKEPDSGDNLAASLDNGGRG